MQLSTSAYLRITTLYLLIVSFINITSSSGSIHSTFHLSFTFPSSILSSTSSVVSFAFLKFCIMRWQNNYGPMKYNTKRYIVFSKYQKLSPKPTVKTINVNLSNMKIPLCTIHLTISCLHLLFCSSDDRTLSLIATLQLLMLY